MMGIIACLWPAMALAVPAVALADADEKKAGRVFVQSCARLVQQPGAQVPSQCLQDRHYQHTT